MMVIGITGGIGAGKSSVTEYLVKKGYAVIDADIIGRNMTADGAPVLEKLNELFGPDGDYGVPGVEITEMSRTVKEKLALKRQVLADVVFSDIEKKKIFDAIMFKGIIAQIDQEIACLKNNHHECIFLDAPLLFEAGIEDRCDAVVLVTAEESVRIRRVMKRDGISEEQIKARIRNQMQDKDKAERSDYIIDNSGDYETLINNVDILIEKIQKNCKNHHSS